MEICTMKNLRIMLLLAATVMVVLGMNRQAAAQEVIPGNLFKNPGFEEGHHTQDGIPQIVSPDNWRMLWLDNVPFEGTEGKLAYRPETVVWYIEDAPLDERPIFFRDGSFALKIFKTEAPLYAAISQDVTGLQVGRKYRISAPIFPDLFDEYKNGQKQIPDDPPGGGFVRFGVAPVGVSWLDTTQGTYSPYWTSAAVSPFYMTTQTYSWDFVATQPNMTVFIEVGSQYPYHNNGFFMDALSLNALNEVVSVPGSTSGGASGSAAAAAASPAATVAGEEVTPREDGSIVHVVGPNDSFWTIAIRYATVLDMTPEQALVQIQQLNGNPAFAVLGQELLIREAGNFVGAEGSGTAVPATTPTVEGETTPGSEAAATQEVITVDPLSTTTTPEAATGEPSLLGSVCVTSFEDINGNGEFEQDAEFLMADAAITLFKDSQTISTFITDGLAESHCFEELENASYQVQIYPPVNYAATTADSWTITVSDGVMVPVEFGLQFKETEVAEADNVDTGEVSAESGAETAVSDATVSETATDTAAADESSGLLTNVGTIVIIIAIVLILLAVAGVVMLRRS